MSDSNKEPQCASCIHNPICGVKDQFLDAQKTVDRLVISSDKKGVMKLSDLAFIQPVTLKCIHYMPHNTSFTR